MCNDVTKQTFYQNNGRRNSSNAVGIIDDARHLFRYCFDTVFENSSNKVIKEKNLTKLFLHV